ncbi:TetR/AcrR family transcriptional regulator [Streptomyces tendae]
MRPVTRRLTEHHAARSAATRAQVLAAVTRMLDSGESFTQISVQRILEEADVSRATFYAHFRGKTDVLVRLSDELRESLLSLGRQWDPGAAGDGAERFTRFFTDIVTVHRAHQGVLVALREAAAYDAEVGDFYTSGLEGFDEIVRATLQAEQAAGSAPPDLDVAAASRIIVWGGTQAIAHHIATDPGDGDAAFAREMGRIWWYGAYRRPE